LDGHVRSDSEQQQQQQQQHQQQQQQQQQQQYPSVAYIDDLLRRCHVPVIRNLRERMAFVIDEEVTAEAKDHVVIHYGFNEELDRAKETFETLDGERHFV
jgi:phage antirepressor YoqD-like protein